MKEPVRHLAATRHRGSALILTVVLTSLLAIVGVLFLMSARLDKMGTTAATDSRELACALDTVLAQIDQTLIDDIPGVGPNQEFYDYPDAENPWLADLEPYSSGRRYYWRQITNLVGPLMPQARDLSIRLIGERDPIDPNLLADPTATTADADGDGVGDAQWFQIPGVTSSRGRTLYAAVRIVDNGAMLNMNTGLKSDFTDPNGSGGDGSSPLHVNVLALAAAPGEQPQLRDEAALLGARANYAADPVATINLTAYERSVIWRYLDVANPDINSPSPYTPFDVSDELELRYRYLLNHRTDTRVENIGRFKPNTISVPVDTGGAALDTWFRRAAGGGSDPNYAYRHIATTYNMDRIITPKPVDLSNGTKLHKRVNVNTTDEETLRAAIAVALLETDPNALDVAEKSAQITANLRDYIDDDDEITVIAGLSSPYYGFERPCIYISEFACRQKRDEAGAVHSSYAVELYKPYFEDRDPALGEWRLVIHNPSSPTDVELPLEWTGTRRFHVVLAEDGEASLSEDYLLFTDAGEPADTMPRYAYNRADYANQPQSMGSGTFEAGATISLQRSVPSVGRWVVVDFVKVPDGWMAIDDVARSLQRDISPHKCIRRLWAPATQVSVPGLGNAAANYVDTQRPEIIQAHPANKPLVNIGQLGMIFTRSAYSVQEGAVAADVLVNLYNPLYARLFNYLTVVDPARYSWPVGETRVMGRININTAPAFVLAQLPWIRYQESAPFARAEEIVNRRRQNGPYRSIGELMQLPSMLQLASDNLDNQYVSTDGTPRGPDLTSDTARDDFEERDLLFTRISDLVTVRSDVFTAYILVRIGEEGPQKRIIALLDRSRVNSSGGRARLLAQHLVPDPR